VCFDTWLFCHVPRRLLGLRRSPGMWLAILILHPLEATVMQRTGNRMINMHVTHPGPKRTPSPNTDRLPARYGADLVAGEWPRRRLVVHSASEMALVLNCMTCSPQHGGAQNWVSPRCMSRSPGLVDGDCGSACQKRQAETRRGEGSCICRGCLW
jgi:hypothetical protein